MMEGSIPSSSSLSTPTASSSSPNAPATAPTTAASLFRPRRSEDWNKYRPYIEQLYRDDQLKLRDVKRIMERDHKFVASEKQYKDRLAAWNIRKNIKAKEVNIMIRKQQKRAARGKQTAFRVAGQKVDTKRIARFVRRYGTNWDNDTRAVEPHQHASPEPETPSDMSYFTPEPDERASTLSPNPEAQPHPFDKLNPIPDSELDDSQSLQVTLSPTTSTHDTPKPIDSSAPAAEDPWHALAVFQSRLLELQETLESTTAGFFSPHEDPRQ